MKDPNKLLQQYKTMTQNLYLMPAQRVATIANRLSIIKRELSKTMEIPTYSNGRARSI